VESGRGANVLASPLAAIAHIASVVAGQPGFAPLGAGELVTTGTITAAHPVRPGETWRSRLQGIALAGLAVSFDNG
jgi:2-oxo-3-hexenedioate decarboxylase